MALSGETRFQEVLRRAVERGASDIHLKTGLPPVIRLDNDLKILAKHQEILSPAEMQKICADIVPSHLGADFTAGREIDMSYTVAGLGRFRINVYRYRSQLGLVARYIPLEIRSVKDLGLPDVISRMALLPRGLILVTGTTGSGKSTTLAAMLNEWNHNRSGHIVTIEDPIEYLIRDRKSIITQREIGIDTASFAAGLRNALRQDPDVIMIGELRDRESIQTALNAAETGHLVVSTLHTKDALETVNRMIGVFEPEAQAEIRMQFASALAGIVSQRLLPALPQPGKKSGGRIPAIEIMVNTARIRDLLLDPRKHEHIHHAIEQGHEAYGMQSFDQHLMALLRERKIARETAIKNSSRPADFELRLKGIESSDGGRWNVLNKGKEFTVTEAARETSRAGVLELDDYRKQQGEPGEES